MLGSSHFPYIESLTVAAFATSYYALPFQIQTDHITSAHSSFVTRFQLKKKKSKGLTKACSPTCSDPCRLVDLSISLPLSQWSVGPGIPYPILK